MDVVASRFDVFLVRLDPTVGQEIRKTRPCLVVSPDEMHRQVATLIIAPMTTSSRAYVSRVPVRFRGRQSSVALDQLRAVDRRRLLRRLGRIDPIAAHRVLSTLTEMFAP